MADGLLATARAQQAFQTTLGPTPPMRVRSTCPCRKLNPDILVMQAAQDWYGQNAADGLYGAGYWRILIQ